MKRIFIVVLVSIFLLALLFAGDDTPEAGDRAAIKQAALDYIEGWYEGNAERMERALHPEFFTKRGIFTNPNTGKTFVRQLDAKMMVDFTRKGGGKNYAKDRQENDLIIYDVYQNTATVRAVSAEYVDYLHLGKFDGEWKIVNVLWEMKIVPPQK